MSVLSDYLDADAKVCWNSLIEEGLSRFNVVFEKAYKRRGQCIEEIREITKDMEEIKKLHRERQALHSKTSKIVSFYKSREKVDDDETADRLKKIKKELAEIGSFEELYQQRADASTEANDLKDFIQELKKKHAIWILLDYANKRLETNRANAQNQTEVRNCRTRITVPKKYEEIFALCQIDAPETIGQLDLLDMHLREKVDTASDSPQFRTHIRDATLSFLTSDKEFPKLIPVSI